MPSDHACEASRALRDQCHCSVLPVFLWTPDLPGRRVLSLSPCVPGGSHSQDQSEKAEDWGAGREGPPRLCCSSQELGTEGLEFTAHIFADFSALCQLQAFTSQKFI